MRASGWIALALLAVQPAEAAEPLLPTRAGETGYLDVPVAESQGRGGAAFSVDLRYAQASDVSRAIAPSPLVMSFGLGNGEAGFALRQGGLPGDARPYGTTATGAGKFSVLEAKGKRPALAIDLLLDHINRTPTGHLRAITSTQRTWRVRATAFGGGVIGFVRPSGWTAGAALSVQGPRQTEFVVEGLRQPGGLLAGAGVRWLPLPQLALGLGTSYLPDDARTVLAGLTVTFLNPAPVRPTRGSEAEQTPEEAGPKQGKRMFAAERPRFALQLRERPVPGGEGGPAPHYPGVTPAAGAEAGLMAAATETAPAEKSSPDKAKLGAKEPAVEVIKLEQPKEGATTLPVMRGNSIVQRRVIDSLIFPLRQARSAPKMRERDAIKSLALRAAAGEGDLVVWATAVGADANKLMSAVGRAVAVKRLAAKLAGLRKDNFTIQIGPGEAASRDRILVALLAPEPGALPAKSKSPPAEVKPAPETQQQPQAHGDAGVEQPPVEAHDIPSKTADENRDAGTVAADAPPDTQPARIEPPVPSIDTPDARPSTPDAVPDTLPDTRPERVERPVPLPPTLKEGNGGEDQLRKAIASFQPGLKQCVDRALKRDPGLRGEARVVLDILASGKVKLSAIHSKTLAGGWFEECVRQASAAWRMPRTPRGYQVEIPIKLHVANGGSP